MLDQYKELLPDKFTCLLDIIGRSYMIITSENERVMGMSEQET